MRVIVRQARVSAHLVLEAGVMNTKLSTDCPTPLKLIDFCVGKLDEGEIDRVFEHLEHCPQCAVFVEKLDTFPIPFLTKIQSMPLTPFRSYLLEPEFSDTLKKLEEILRNEPPAE